MNKYPRWGFLVYFLAVFFSVFFFRCHVGRAEVWRKAGKWLTLQALYEYYGSIKAR